MKEISTLVLNDLCIVKALIASQYDLCSFCLSVYQLRILTFQINEIVVPFKISNEINLSNVINTSFIFIEISKKSLLSSKKISEIVNLEVIDQ